MAFEAFVVQGRILIEGIKDAQKQIEGVAGKMSKVGEGMKQTGRKMTMGLTLPIVAAGTASYKMAGDFDESMRAVNVMLRAGEDEFQNYKKEVLAISSATGKSSDDVANSFYQIVSAGFRGADAIEILENSVRAATGGFADASLTTSAMTKAMNIFQMEGAEGSTRVLDTMFGIVDTGLISFEELASVFPRASQSAAGLGISIEETGAALGTLSKISGSSEQAATALDAALMQLINPSSDLQDLYEEWGVENGPEAVEAFGGLEGIMNKLMDATGGNIDQLTKYFPNVRAIRALFPLITTNAEDFAEAQEVVGNSTGKAGDAFNEMAQGPGFELKTFLQTLKNGMISLGDTLSGVLGPHLTKVTEKIGDMVKWFSELDPKWQKIIMGIVAAIAALGPVLMIVGGAFMFLNTILATTPIGWIIIGIVAALAALVAIGIVVWKNWDKIANWFKDVWGKIADFFTKVWEKIVEDFKKAWDFIKNIFFNFTPLGMVIKNWDTIVQWFKDLWGRVREVFVQAWDKIKEIFFNYTPHGIVISKWDVIAEWFRNLWERVKTFFREALDAIIEWMLNWIPGLQLIVDNWDVIVEAFRLGWEAIKQFFIDYGTAVNEFFIGIFTAIRDFIVILWNGIKDFFVMVWQALYQAVVSDINRIKEIITTVFNAVKNFIMPIWNSISGFFKIVWDNIKNDFIIAIDFIKTTVQTAFNWLKDSVIMPVWNSVRDFFSTLWGEIENSLSGFKEAFLKIWDNIKNGMKGPINGIIGFFNTLIGGVQDAINSVVRMLNRINIRVPDWIGKIIPGLAGKKWENELGEVSFGGIPLLAEGGNILKGGMAMVGEAGPELVALPKGATVSPLSKGGITMNNNITSPKPLTESEIRRQLDLLSRKLGYRMGI
jgi:TP901 family phage tail tape measure protein